MSLIFNQLNTTTMKYKRKKKRPITISCVLKRVGSSIGNRMNLREIIFIKKDTSSS